MNRYLLIVVGASLVAPAALAEPVTYRIDPEKSEVVAITKPAGIGAGLSHHHLLEAKGLEGQVVHDAAAPERSSVEISAPTTRLVNDDPAALQRHGLKAALSEDDRKKVAGSIQGADQLDGPKFPRLSFKSTSARPLGNGKLELVGQLSIRGVGREVKLPVTVAVAADGTLRGEGKLQITHTQFGFKPASLLLGAIANADEVEIEVKLVAAPAAPKP
ncbi:MAG TPA: YceI family protein [Myxococcales bacterium]|nr:YceI family protein [Myxococcales bacterium]